jgi:alpha-mannosidase
MPPPLRVDAPNEVVETLKRAEDGNGWILRLFEAEGTACRCGLDFGGTPCRIEQTNLLEETEALLLERGTHLDLTLRAFGIVTLRVL